MKYKVYRELFLKKNELQVLFFIYIFLMFIFYYEYMKEYIEDQSTKDLIYFENYHYSPCFLISFTFTVILGLTGFVLFIKFHNIYTILLWFFFSICTNLVIFFTYCKRKVVNLKALEEKIKQIDKYIPSVRDSLNSVIFKNFALYYDSTLQSIIKENPIFIDTGNTIFLNNDWAFKFQDQMLFVFKMTENFLKLQYVFDISLEFYIIQKDSLKVVTKDFLWIYDKGFQDGNYWNVIEKNQKFFFKDDEISIGFTKDSVTIC